MTKATDISKKVKDEVWQRDNQQCIICGNPQAMPNAHYIRRAKGGLGIPENIVTLCLKCHTEFDGGNQFHKAKIKAHLKRLYPNWENIRLIYSKWL